MCTVPETYQHHCCRQKWRILCAWRVWLLLRKFHYYIYIYKLLYINYYIIIYINKRIILNTIYSFRKKSLYVVNLEEPKELAKTISNANSKWEVGIMEWNPHSSKSTLIASAVCLCYSLIILSCCFWDYWLLLYNSSIVTLSQANQEVVIWDSVEGRSVCAIPGHNRAVSDISWSPFDPNVLATASLDTYPIYFCFSLNLPESII